VTSEPAAVLIVEDSAVLAEMYVLQLQSEGLSPSHVADLKTARGFLRANRPLAILLDLRLPDGDGITLLRELRAAGSDIAVIVMTAHGSINTAIDAMKAGADDFIIKPFAPERMITTLRNCIERRRLVRIVEIMSPSQGGDSFEGFVGTDLAMQALYRMIDQAARSKATVFITGESGTGKEVCAEAIHRRSDRAAGPFVALNCGAIPKDLIESEVFGHVKGAFTGATSDREGAASRAQGGTLFLDEICEMDLTLQTKLLRFLQTGIVQKVGSDRTSQADIRIVCATNRDPLTEVQTGRFREDLYYRLHVVPLHLPPLRERGEDVLRIARHFLAAFGAEEKRRFTGLSAEVEAVFLDYRWPGNVRQLQNVIRNVVVLHDGTMVTPDMLPAPLRDIVPMLANRPHSARAIGQDQAQPNWRDGIRTLDVVEREAIEAAIAACGGNMTEAAQRLGISVKTIYRKRQDWAGGSSD
jgi:two-component system, repressor protein LuxO